MPAWPRSSSGQGTRVPVSSCRSVRSVSRLRRERSLRPHRRRQIPALNLDPRPDRHQLLLPLNGFALKAHPARRQKSRTSRPLTAAGYGAVARNSSPASLWPIQAFPMPPGRDSGQHRRVLAPNSGHRRLPQRRRRDSSRRSSPDGKIGASWPSWQPGLDRGRGRGGWWERRVSWSSPRLLRTGGRPFRGLPGPPPVQEDRHPALARGAPWFPSPTSPLTVTARGQIRAMALGRWGGTI